jgi:DNA-binding CsgD family transcriptional regulator
VRLSPRQRDVLFLVCKGLHNSEIGSQLGLSEGAVKYHMNHMLLLFDVTNRTELVGRFAIEAISEAGVGET